MPKPSPISATELVVAGQPKASTQKLLRQAGEQLTAQRLAHALQRVESARTDFCITAIEAGLFILAKKQTLKHGQFQPFAAQLWSINHSEEGQHLAIDGEALNNFTRSLRYYAKLAQHFIADLEQGSFQPEYRDQLVIGPSVSTDQVLAVVQSGGPMPGEISKAIAKFVGGRSLRRMIIDLTRAEKAGDDEEAAEAAEAEKRSRKKLPDQTPGQMDFLQDMYRPLSEVETLIKDPGFRRKTTKEFWTNLADKLDAQATAARAVAREIAS